MNEQNLIPVSSRTSSELREQTRKGGIASGVARRERKALRERLALIADEVITNKAGEKAEAEDVIAMQLRNKAIAGDLKAIRLYAELTGQLVQKLEVEATPPPTIANIFLDR